MFATPEYIAKAGVACQLCGWIRGFHYVQDTVMMIGQSEILKFWRCSRSLLRVIQAQIELFWMFMTKRSNVLRGYQAWAAVPKV